MSVNKTNLAYWAVVVGVFLTDCLCAAALCLSAEITGPSEVETCSGLVELSIQPQQNHTYEWLLIEPDTLRTLTWPDQSRLVFAAPKKAGTVRVALVDVLVDRGPDPTAAAALPKVVVEICKHVVRVTGQDGDGDGDEDDDGDDKPVKSVKARIIYESRTVGPHWGDVVNDLRADPVAPLRLIDVDTADPIDAEYARKADVKNGPVLILDDDDDPAQVTFLGPCPMSPKHPDGTRDTIAAFIDRFTAAGTFSQPSSGAPTEDVRLEDVAPVPAAIEKEPEVSDFLVETHDGMRYGVNQKTGDMWPVDEAAGTFCVAWEGGTKCFTVTTPRQK